MKTRTFARKLKNKIIARLQVFCPPFLISYILVIQYTVNCSPFLKCLLAFSYSYSQNSQNPSFLVRLATKKKKLVERKKIPKENKLFTFHFNKITELQVSLLQLLPGAFIKHVMWLCQFSLKKMIFVWEQKYFCTKFAAKDEFSLAPFCMKVKEFQLSVVSN